MHRESCQALATEQLNVLMLVAWFSDIDII